MIKTMKQAKEVQERRVASGLRGYAKAVRRFLVRGDGVMYKALKPGLMVWWGSK